MAGISVGLVVRTLIGSINVEGGSEPLPTPKGTKETWIDGADDGTKEETKEGTRVGVDVIIKEGARVGT